MNKVFVLCLVLMLVGSVSAVPDFSKAKKVRNNLYYLGEAEIDGEVLQGYAVVSTAKVNGSERVKSKDCYAHIAEGLKWKVAEPCIINTANTRGMNESEVVERFDKSIKAWEKVKRKNLIGDLYVTDQPLQIDPYSPDGFNEIYFGDIPFPGAVGVTLLWGVFNAPVEDRYIVEWDQLYDDVDYDWSVDCESEDCSSKMDFQSVATHELGHTVGMDDLYNSECNDATMYGYVTEGETKKRDLAKGDMFGLRSLYRGFSFLIEKIKGKF